MLTRNSAVAMGGLRNKPPPAQSSRPDFRITSEAYRASRLSLRSSTIFKSSIDGGLPLELWNLVFSYLLPIDLLTVAQLNSTFRLSVTTSIPWRFFQSLFPTSRRIWALTWDEAIDGYYARTVPPSNREPVSFRPAQPNLLPQNQPFAEIFIGTNRRVIEFFGPSVRHRHDTFLTQTDRIAGVCQSWRITSTPQYAMGHVVGVKKVEVNLPPLGNHLRPAGLDVVGTFLFWVEFQDNPLPFTITGKQIHFPDQIGENVLWPLFGALPEPPTLSPLYSLFLSWGETPGDFSGQMVSASSSTLPLRYQNLRLFDYDTGRVYSIPLLDIIGAKGPWLGKWRLPWILPWGFDDDGNLLFKILDAETAKDKERIRCVQISYNLAAMKTTFAVEIFDDIQLLNPWNFQLFSDQCWGYPAYDAQGDLWCVLRDLRDGNIVRRVGPLNCPGSIPEDYSCHISMFHVIFQDKSLRRRPLKKPGYAPLRVFPIKPLLPSTKRSCRIPWDNNLPSQHAQVLYELSPPSVDDPSPPGYWTFGGEDAAERYLFFQGFPTETNPDTLHLAWEDCWKRWVVWDSVGREWSFVNCGRQGGGEGVYCLFSEIDANGREHVGLDWVRMELSGTA